MTDVVAMLPAFRRIAYGVLRPWQQKDLAPDLVQEAALAVWQMSPVNRTHALRRAKGAMLDHIRSLLGPRRDRHMGLTFVDPASLAAVAGEADPVRDVSARERLGRLDRHLTPAERKLVLARFVDEVRLQDIAAEERVTESRVCQRVRDLRMRVA